MLKPDSRELGDGTGTVEPKSETKLNAVNVNNLNPGKP